MTVEQLTAEAARLSEEDRLELASRITSALGTGMSADIELSWAVEIRRRIADLDSGKARTRNVDEVIAELLAETDVAR